MKKRVPLSPSQAAAFTMGRTLLVFESWAHHSDSPVELERAMLIDFARREGSFLVKPGPFARRADARIPARNAAQQNQPGNCGTNPL